MWIRALNSLHMYNQRNHTGNCLYLSSRNHNHVLQRLNHYFHTSRSHVFWFLSIISQHLLTFVYLTRLCFVLFYNSYANDVRGMAQAFDRILLFTSNVLNFNFFGEIFVRVPCSFSLHCWTFVVLGNK